ncbi:MAG: L-aspartate oxidase [Candidatus Anammoxibacter sp.]
MNKHIDSRRFLVSFDSHKIPHIFTDVLVVGSGIAGLSATIEAAKSCSVLVVTKDKISESNTQYAQGGIASVISNKDSFSEHIKDTLDAGHGLCDSDVVDGIVKEGPLRINELISMGVNFDMEDGSLALTQEGGHSHRRILRANGDTTGKEIERGLINTVKANKNVTIFEYTFTIDLLVIDGVCKGIIAWHSQKGSLLIWAKQTILATGGCGRLYRETTNPKVAKGDGIAIAYRAGVEIQNMEFIQFHPTTLYIAGASRTLISETVRGEGGILKNKNGERFMVKYHKDMELAHRDVVSRSILKEIQATDHTHVYLDVTHIPVESFSNRFPGIKAICDSFDIDITKDMIPVRPSAHYMIGGVKTDQRGMTNVLSLYACGEVASTGLHGANRLGSNSLLEGLVYGHRVGCEVRDKLKDNEFGLSPQHISYRVSTPKQGELDLGDVKDALQSLMWRNVGIERDKKHLSEAKEMINYWSNYVLDKEFLTPVGWELQNMLTVASIITEMAEKREETRGVHYRKDFPAKDDKKWKQQITIKRDIPL